MSYTREQYALDRLQPFDPWSSANIWYHVDRWVTNGHWVMRWRDRCDLPDHVQKGTWPIQATIDNWKVSDIRVTLSAPTLSDSGKCCVGGVGKGIKRRFAMEYIPLVTGLDLKWLITDTPCEEHKYMLGGFEDGELQVAIMPWRSVE